MDPIPRLTSRAPDSHKGDYGHALLVGGSRGMTGAIALAGMATLRSGAGLVTLAVPDVCIDTVAALEPCYMTVPLPSDRHGRFTGSAEPMLHQWMGQVTAAACGPGMGQSEGRLGVGDSDAIGSLVRSLYDSATVPLVVDADALNALARHPEGITAAGGPRILTPHPGEFDRMAGKPMANRAERERLAVEMAARHRVVIVLKGHKTLITDGQQIYHNGTGNAGMATGGSGDVLTGVVTALLCQGLEVMDAARLGVHVHGLAGDCAAQRLSMVAMTATDIIESLPDAWLQMQ